MSRFKRLVGEKKRIDVRNAYFFRLAAAPYHHRDVYRQERGRIGATVKIAHAIIILCWV